MIPYSCQWISDEDIASVVAVLRSDRLTQGPAIADFERSVADYCSARHAIAVCNGTAALHLACLSLDLGPGDWLWTSPNSFVASANCARYCGANVDFVDIDPRTYNLCPEALADKLATADRAGRLPKIVVPVHFAGQSCDMEAISELAQRYNIAVVEDASHALSGAYRGDKVGCCRHSAMTVFSFHAVKPITTGEGGMVTTNSAELNRRLRLLGSHGITRDPSQTTSPPAGGWAYEQQALGHNYRLTDIQAALGASQMRRVDEFARRRAQIARGYCDALADLPLVQPYQDPATGTAWHLFVAKIAEDCDVPRKTVFDCLQRAGIGVNVHYQPIHTQPYYRQLGFAAGDFPNAEAYYRRALSLPLHPKLTEAEQDRVIASLRGALTGA